MLPTDLPTKKGLFVVLEGIDGAGTTTQMKCLKEQLLAKGYGVHLTREPSDNFLGLLIRKALTATLKDSAEKPVSLNDETLALLFAADRLHHLAEEILPALHEGKIVICDRYYGSSLVYQGALCGLDWVKEINSRAIKPDVTLYFSLPVAVASARRRGRGEPKERFEEDRLLEEVADRYEQLYANEAAAFRIDATKSVAEVTALCLKAMGQFLAKME